VAAAGDAGVRAGVPLDVLRDPIEPLPTFAEVSVAALEALGERSAAPARATA
jgi:hypothetical protein